jgi:hypothetical protein
MHWKNHCGHKDNEFIGTFQYPGTDDIYDVFIHGQLQEVCARFGDEGPDYLSIGEMHYLVRSVHLAPKYAAIYAFIMEQRLHYQSTINHQLLDIIKLQDKRIDAMHGAIQGLQRAIVSIDQALMGYLPKKNTNVFN